jgi:hypothetical protein
MVLKISANSPKIKKSRAYMGERSVKKAKAKFEFDVLLFDAVMKKTTLAPTLILVLLFSAIGVASLVDFAKANPLYLSWYPSEPITTPPIITLQSPYQNQNYNSTDMWLNFTVSKPETWFSQTELSESYMPGTYMAVGRLLSYHYILDGNESQNISVEDKFHRIDPPDKPAETLCFSVNLTLTEGAHNITVVVECESTYVIEEYRFSDSPKTTPILGSSETIFFNVESEPKLFPTLLVATASGASATVAGWGLFVYFKKRKH